MRLVRYTAVNDVGHMINPLLVEGQLHGGIVRRRPGPDGEHRLRQLRPAAVRLIHGLRDAARERLLAFVLGENEVPTKTNPLGVKGAGKSGTVGALSSIMNAINDAMARIGAPYVQMPATPEKIWRAVRAAGRSGG